MGRQQRADGALEVGEKGHREVGRGVTDSKVRVEEEEKQETHSGLKGNKLEDHLHGENPGENHVEDVHGVVKEMRLAVVLRGGEQKHHVSFRKK